MEQKKFEALLVRTHKLDVRIRDRIEALMAKPKSSKLRDLIVKAGQNALEYRLEIASLFFIRGEKRLTPILDIESSQKQGLSPVVRLHDMAQRPACNHCKGNRGDLRSPPGECASGEKIDSEIQQWINLEMKSGELAAIPDYIRAAIEEIGLDPMIPNYTVTFHGRRAANVTWYAAIGYAPPALASLLQKGKGATYFKGKLLERGTTNRKQVHAPLCMETCPACHGSGVEAD